MTSNILGINAIPQRGLRYTFDGFVQRLIEPSLREAQHPYHSIRLVADIVAPTLDDLDSMFNLRSHLRPGYCARLYQLDDRKTPLLEFVADVLDIPVTIYWDAVGQ